MMWFRQTIIYESFVFAGVHLGACGTQSIRFRPTLLFQPHHVDIFADIFQSVIRDFKWSWMFCDMMSTRMTLWMYESMRRDMWSKATLLKEACNGSWNICLTNNIDSYWIIIWVPELYQGQKFIFTMQNKLPLMIVVIISMSCYHFISFDCTVRKSIVHNGKGFSALSMVHGSSWAFVPRFFFHLIPLTGA